MIRASSRIHEHHKLVHLYFKLGSSKTYTLSIHKWNKLLTEPRNIISLCNWGKHTSSKTQQRTFCAFTNETRFSQNPGNPWACTFTKTEIFYKTCILCIPKWNELPNVNLNASFRKPKVTTSNRSSSRCWRRWRTPSWRPSWRPPCTGRAASTPPRSRLTSGRPWRAWPRTRTAARSAEKRTVFEKERESEEKV